MRLAPRIKTWWDLWRGRPADFGTFYPARQETWRLEPWRLQSRFVVLATELKRRRCVPDVATLRVLYNHPSPRDTSDPFRAYSTLAVRCSFLRLRWRERHELDERFHKKIDMAILAIADDLKAITEAPMTKDYPGTQDVKKRPTDGSHQKLKVSGQLSGKGSPGGSRIPATRAGTGSRTERGTGA